MNSILYFTIFLLNSIIFSLYNTKPNQNNFIQIFRLSLVELTFFNIYLLQLLEKINIPTNYAFNLCQIIFILSNYFLKQKTISNLIYKTIISFYLIGNDVWVVLFYNLIDTLIGANLINIKSKKLL